MAQNPSEVTNTIQETLTCEEIAKALKLHPSTIRKMFLDEPGVIRIGRPRQGRRRKRSYFTLRIPPSIAARKLGTFIVGGSKSDDPLASVASTTRPSKEGGAYE